jgi:hypothetical protein
MTTAPTQNELCSLPGNYNLADELSRITADLTREFATTCPPAAIRNAVLHAHQRLTSYTGTTALLLPLIRSKAHTTLTAIALPYSNS